MKDFVGKTAVVTGGASGIGRGMVERFAAAGMNVVLADIEASALDRAVGELTAKGAKAAGVLTDVSSLASVENLAREAQRLFGPVHVLCNNAGVEGYLGGPLWKASQADWDWTMGVLMQGPINGIRAFVPGMVEHGGEGHVVNTASTMGLVRGANMYGIAKHAVVALSETLYAEFAEQNVNLGISVLCPGMVNTRIFEGSRNRPYEVEQETGNDLRQHFNNLLKTALSPSVVADLVFKAIEDRTFYILTDHDWDGDIRNRMECILERRNPVLDVAVLEGAPTT